MEQRLKRLDNDKLIDVVKNHKRYGYDNETREAAIAVLKERGYTMEELEMFGFLENKDYNDAETHYNAYRRNSKIGIAVLLLSGGILAPVYLIFTAIAYNNQNRFYKALGRTNNNTFIADIFAVMIYFHLRNKMKEELQGVS